MQCELSDPQLGVLELGCDPYVVVSLDVGSPAIREVTRNRSLGDGSLDDTKFLGARAITLSIRFNDLSACPTDAVDSMQTLIDRLTPYMSPHRRPTLTWQLPRSTELRSAVVRGANWGWTVAGPKAQAIAPQWVVPSGEILAGGPNALHCVTIQPSSDVELGRHYGVVANAPPQSGNSGSADDAYGPYYTNTAGVTQPANRAYPASGPVGGRALVNPGTTDAHWVLTFFGPVVNPKFTINGIVFSVDRRGGLTLVTGQSLVVDTRARTALLGGVAGASRYQYVNYEDWSWDDLMLKPGSNAIRFDGTGLTAQSAAQLCYTPTYL